MTGDQGMLRRQRPHQIGGDGPAAQPRNQHLALGRQQRFQQGGDGLYGAGESVLFPPQQAVQLQRDIAAYGLAQRGSSLLVQYADGVDGEALCLGILRPNPRKAGGRLGALLP